MTFRTVLGKTTSFTANVRPITLGAAGREIDLGTQVGILNIQCDEVDAPGALSPGLTTEEKKMVVKTAMEAIKYRQTTVQVVPDDCLVFPVNSHTLLLCPSGSQDAQSVNQDTIANMLPVVSGRCRLRVDTHSDGPPRAVREWRTYVKSYHGNQAHAKTRWVCYEDVDFNDYSDDELVPRTAPVEDGTTMVSVTVKIIASVEKIAWGDLVNLQYDETQATEASRAKEIINSMLGAAFDPSGQCARDGHKYYPESGDKKVAFGLCRQEGISRQLHVIDDRLMISEQPCSRLVVDATSVAGFMNNFLDLSSADVSTAEIASAIRSSMCGLRVKLEDQPGKPEGLICGVSSFDAKTTLAMTPECVVADECLNKRKSLGFPKLPCLNVGTKKQPKFVAPELCTILPNQPFGGNLSQEQQQSLSPMRPSVEPFKDIDGPSIRLGPTLEKQAVIAIPLRGQSVWEFDRVFYRDRFKVVFVEIGLEPSRSQLWAEFRDNLSFQIAQQGAGIVQDNTVRLKSLADSSSNRNWQHELLPSTVNEDKNCRTFLIFGVDAREKKSAISKRLKDMCDIGLGVQSLCISRSELEDAIYRQDNGKPDMRRFAKNTLNSMYAHNADPSNIVNHLLVGLHVTELSRPADGAMHTTHGRKHKSEEKWYLVSFSARAAESSTNYNHQVSLHKVERNNGIDVPEMFQVFLAKCCSTTTRQQTSGFARISVYRSGVPVPVSNVARSTAPISQQSQPPDYRKSDRQYPRSATLSQLHGATGFDFDLGALELGSRESGTTGNETKAKTTCGQAIPGGLDARTPQSMLDILSDEADALLKKLNHTNYAARPKLSYYYATVDKWSCLTQEAHNALATVFDSSFTDNTLNLEDPAHRNATFFVTAADRIELRPRESFEVYRMTRSKAGDISSDVRKCLSLMVIRHIGRAIDPSSAPDPMPSHQFRSISKPSSSTSRKVPWPSYRPYAPDVTSTSWAAVSNLASNLGTSSGFLKAKSVQRQERSPLSAFGDKGAIPRHESSFLSSGVVPPPPPPPPPPSSSTPSPPPPPEAQPRPALIDAATIQPIHAAFHDFRLKLHDTTFPIPCYLAQKVAKRAIMHMESDNWDEHNETRPYKLRPASQKLDGTLYYLD